jgi:hypothetical protein
VSSDRIALAAIRCAGLLEALVMFDESGTRRVFEVYPAVALKVWGIESKDQEAPEAVPADSEGDFALKFGALRSKCPWLEFPPDAIRKYSSNGDAFDALIASLITRAAYLGRTSLPTTSDEINLAKLEGWIAVPEMGSLLKLIE